MNEIKKTLATLKARWPEVTLLISIFMLMRLLSKLRHGLPEFKIIFPIVGLLAILAFAILVCGFLRTVYLENDKRQSTQVLFQTGKKFFCRVLGFYLFLWLLMLAGFFVFKMMFGDTFIKWSMWYFIGWPLILIKIWLLVPALIIVFDIGVSESFKKLKRYKLSDAKPLIILFLIHLALPVVWRVFKLNTEAINSHFYLSLFQSVVSGFLLLMIAVTAIRFVAPINLTNEQSL